MVILPVHTCAPLKIQLFLSMNPPWAPGTHKSVAPECTSMWLGHKLQSFVSVVGRERTVSLKWRLHWDADIVVQLYGSYPPWFWVICTCFEQGRCLGISGLHHGPASLHCIVCLREAGLHFWRLFTEHQDPPPSFSALLWRWVGLKDTGWFGRPFIFHYLKTSITVEDP